MFHRKSFLKAMVAGLGLTAALALPAAGQGGGFGGDPNLEVVVEGASWRLIDVHDTGGLTVQNEDPPSLLVFPARDVDALEASGHLPASEAQEIRDELFLEGLDYRQSDIIFVIHVEAAEAKAQEPLVIAGDCWGWQDPSTKEKTFNWSDGGEVRTWNVEESLFEGSVEAKVPLTVEASATVTYQLKNAFCVPYKFRLIETRIEGDADITDGYVEADAEVDYSNEWKWTKEVYEVDLGRITFSVGPVPVHLNFALPLDIGLDTSVAVNGSAKVRAELASANAHFDVTCDQSDCDGDSSYDYDFDLQDPELSATVNAKAKLWARATVRVDVYQEDIAHAKVSASGFVSAHLFGYAGNTCGDADGDGSQDWVTGLLLDGDVGYEIEADIGGAFFPDKSWDLLSSTYHLVLWDLLGEGQSEVLVPLVTGPTEAEVGESVTFTFRTRPCYPFSEDVELKWYGGVSGGATVTPPDGVHSHTQLVTRGDYSVVAYPFRDTHGRYLQDYEVRRTLTVDFPAFDEPQDNDYFASEMVSGDFDCDGLADLAVSTPYEDLEGRADVGLVTVIFSDQDSGGIPGMSTGRIKHLSEPSVFTSGVPMADTYFGASTVAGDFDNDGCDDLAVGAPGRDGGKGMVKVYYGDPATGVALERFTWLYLGSFGLGPFPPAADDRFGYDLAAGDLNGDGWDDLAVAIPGRDNGVGDYRYGKGQVAVVYGGPFFSNHDRCEYSSHIGGYALDNNCAFMHLRQGFDGVPDVQEASDGRYMKVAIGDFDSDGYGDLVVTYPMESISGQRQGLGFVFRGDSAGLDGHGPYGTSVLDVRTFSQSTLSGGGTGAEASDFAFRAAAAGDFDGDGYDDLALGSENEDWGPEVNAGVVQVVAGSAAGLDFSRSTHLQVDQWDAGWVASEENRFGASVAAGDFDGDGLDDLAIGAPGLSVFVDPSPGMILGAGGVVVAYGTPSFVFETDGPGEGYSFDRSPAGGLEGPVHADISTGRCLAPGDFDGDGILDLAIGSAGTNVDGATRAGSANVIYGGTERPRTSGQVHLIQN